MSSSGTKDDGNSTNSDGKDTTAKITKNVRFGLIELGIFIGLWVVLAYAFKVYYNRAKKSLHL